MCISILELSDAWRGIRLRVSMGLKGFEFAVDKEPPGAAG